MEAGRLDGDAGGHDGRHESRWRQHGGLEYCLHVIEINGSCLDGQPLQRSHGILGPAAGADPVAEACGAAEGRRIGRSLGHEPALAEHREMREAGRHVAVVDGREDRPPHQVGIGHEPFQFPPFDRIETAERIVEQQHVRIVHQRPREQEPFGVAVSEGVERIVSSPVQAGHRQGAVDRRPERLAPQPPLGGPEFHELVHANAGPRGQPGRHVADRRPHGLRLPPRRPPVHDDVAGVQRQHARRRSERRRLAGTAAADQSRRLPGQHPQ